MTSDESPSWRDKWKWKAILDPLSGIGHIKCGDEAMITDLPYHICVVITNEHNAAVEEMTDVRDD